jgi:hypothetical protein
VPGRWSRAWALLLLVAGCRRQPPDTRVALELNLDSACNPAQATCPAKGRGVQLWFQPRTAIRPLQAFPVTVHLAGLDPDIVTVDFSMPSMNMGWNRYRLSRQSGGVWSGEVILPVCSSGRRDWVAQVEVETSRRRLTARFPLQTER